MEDGNLSGENQGFACLGINPAQCMDCLNANGEPPWADRPTKSYCLAYPREEGERKPPSVYYDGGPCRFHRPVR